MNCPIVKMAHLMQLVHSATANRENVGKKTAYNNYSVDVQKCWVSLQRCKAR